MTNTNRPEVIARHVATCCTKLGEALHYHRFFGHPIAAFDASHNEQRAVANERTVIALAAQAGEFCAYSGFTPSDAGLFGELADKALSVDRINSAFVDGYYNTLETLGVAGDDPMPIDGPSRYRALAS